MRLAFAANSSGTYQGEGKIDSAAPPHPGPGLMKMFRGSILFCNKHSLQPRQNLGPEGRYSLRRRCKPPACESYDHRRSGGPAQGACAGPPDLNCVNLWRPVAHRPVDLFSYGCRVAGFPPFPRWLLAQGQRGRVGRSCCLGLMDLGNYDACALGGSTPLWIRPNSRCRLKADDSQSHSC